MSDWYEAEQPLGDAVVEELQRLKRRARARITLVLTLSVLLTAAFLYKRGQKVRVHKARVVIAVTEGSLAQRHTPMPKGELRSYVLGRLLGTCACRPTAACERGEPATRDEMGPSCRALHVAGKPTSIEEIIEQHDLSPLRRKMGMRFAVSEFHEALDVQVVRNYFMELYSIDAPRSARIALSYTDADPERGFEIVHQVADVMTAAQNDHIVMLADQLSEDAERALSEARAQAAALELQVAEAAVALARAERSADPAQFAAMRMHTVELQRKLYRENERVAGLISRADADLASAEIIRSGHAISLGIVEEVKPFDDGPPPLYFQIILGTMFFFVVLPTVSLFVGAFDTRVHDREDVERLGLPVLGHVPPFPGDGVGSLKRRVS